MKRICLKNKVILSKIVKMKNLAIALIVASCGVLGNCNILSTVFVHLLNFPQIHFTSFLCDFCLLRQGDHRCKHRPKGDSQN